MQTLPEPTSCDGSTPGSAPADSGGPTLGPLLGVPIPLAAKELPPSVPLTVIDAENITPLLMIMLQRAGLSVREAAKRMGIRDESLRQYTSGRRLRPSLVWFLRLVQLCGGRVVLEFPHGR